MSSITVSYLAELGFKYKEFNSETNSEISKTISFRKFKEEIAKMDNAKIVLFKN